MKNKNSVRKVIAKTISKIKKSEILQKFFASFKNQNKGIKAKVGAAAMGIAMPAMLFVGCGMQEKPDYIALPDHTIVSELIENPAFMVAAEEDSSINLSVSDNSSTHSSESERYTKLFKKYFKDSIARTAGVNGSYFSATYYCEYEGEDLLPLLNDADNAIYILSALDMYAEDLDNAEVLLDEGPIVEKLFELNHFSSDLAGYHYVLDLLQKCESAQTVEETSEIISELKTIRDTMRAFTSICGNEVLRATYNRAIKAVGYKALCDYYGVDELPNIEFSDSVENDGDNYYFIATINGHEEIICISEDTFLEKMTEIYSNHKFGEDGLIKKENFDNLSELNRLSQSGIYGLEKEDHLFAEDDLLLVEQAKLTR